jgi:mRNA-degrading endonuclease RelE of RelBE toxin-antitoxin system
MAVRYSIFIEPDVHAMRDKLPGHVRQRIRRAIEELVERPRPPATRQLDTAAIDLPIEVEIRRLRLDSWRLIYAINDTEEWVWILGLHRRPPYDYDDLAAIATKLRA